MIEQEIRKVLEDHGCDLAYPIVYKESLARELAACIKRYGIVMHDRGNFHRKPWGYVPEDRQEKARHAAVEAFQGGER